MEVSLDGAIGGATVGAAAAGLAAIEDLLEGGHPHQALHVWPPELPALQLDLISFCVCVCGLLGSCDSQEGQLS